MTGAARTIVFSLLFLFFAAAGFAASAPRPAPGAKPAPLPGAHPSPAATPLPNQKPNGLIILLTDYGDQDFYVGALKGKIYSIFPQARIDSISNEVPQFNIREGAYLLALSAPEFPPGTIFCVVVDPGEQSSRNAIVVETRDGKYYVAPDNGVLTLVLQRSRVQEVRKVSNPGFIKAWSSGAEGFQGTDIFGPTAAELARGVPIEAVGPEASNLVTFKVSHPAARKGEVDGEVEHVDWFGNIHTNIPGDLLQKLGVAPGRSLRIQIGAETVVAPYVNTYSQVGQGNWLVLINDVGNLEIARNQASADAILQVHAGSRVRVNY